jgi:hypothetical protein
MWASPLKPPKAAKAKEEKETIEKFKKPKPVLTKACVKRIADVKSVDRIGCEWADRWVDQLIRENMYPPQFLSEDFDSMLGKFMEIKTALDILSRFKSEYRRAFPLSETAETIPDKLEWLIGVLRSDPVVIKSLPPHYLD